MSVPASSSGGAEQRLFFALWPDDEQRVRIARCAAELTLYPPAHPVGAQNYHLTLAFVGTVPGALVDEVRRIGSELRCPACALDFDAYEYWPKPEVIVVAARRIPAALEQAWSDLHGRLAAAQFTLRPKRLRPHVTVARKVTQAPVLPTMSPFSWRPQTFSLVRSQTGGAESVYTVVDTWPLLYGTDETQKSP